MDWNKGYTASYSAYILDTVSLRELSRIEITGGSINRTEDGLRESADIECINYDQSVERWIRIYLDVTQNGSSAHVPLFTGLACSPSREMDGILTTNTLQCYSVLKPAQDVLLGRGYYVPGEKNGAKAIKDLLAVTAAPVEILGEAPALSGTIIAEDGESCLTMADKILESINWRMSILGDGTIQIGPKPNEAIAVFNPIDNDSIEPQITAERDWYECPNVFRVVQGDITAVARDDDPDSYLSTISRGREIWAEETSAQLNTGESISGYAQRRLKELQVVAWSVSYDRRYRPDVYVGDLIRMHYPKQGLDGIFQVTSQSIELGYGAKTSEEVISYGESR